MLASTGLFAIVFGFSRAQTDSWGSPVTLVRLALGVVLLAAFIQVQRRVADPLLPLQGCRVKEAGDGLAVQHGGACFPGPADRR